MVNYKDVSSYYDNYWSTFENKQETKPNLRHRKIIHELNKLGLNKNSNILEIGCGGAVLTNLISKKVTKGKIVGVDISKETIEYNKIKFKNKKNIFFEISDMTDFSHELKFDFVVFPDVLEHIPIEAHSNIFYNLKNSCHDDTVIFINIPEPNHLEWLIKYKPELLQLIDQPLHVYPFSKAIYENNFYIVSINSYSLWASVNDYQMMVVKPKTDLVTVSKKSKLKIFIDRIYYRLTSL